MVCRHNRFDTVLSLWPRNKVTALVRQLPKDSLMKVINPYFGYGKVQLQNGQAYYVASEDIKPASVELVARVLTPASTFDREPATTGELRWFRSWAK